MSLFHIADGPFTIVLEFISNAVRNKQGQMEAYIIIISILFFYFICIVKW